MVLRSLRNKITNFFENLEIQEIELRNSLSRAFSLTRLYRLYSIWRKEMLYIALPEQQKEITKENKVVAPTKFLLKFIHYYLFAVK